MSGFKVREPQPGEILGSNYLVEKELGRGGFGVVFKARHVDIDRIVAIKVLLATYASRDPSAKDRFRREATIAASLNYPNSLRVFDYGETDEGVFYLVMEYVAGGDLSQALRREGPFPPARAIHIARQVLYALSEAHARGIVHRDIKPDNIMLCPLSYDNDFVKVMDFGIAKMVESNESITKAGMTLGTPRYMPIEQLKGERLAPSSDLYAVGLVLFEMLLNRPAFTGESAVDTALAVMRGDPVTVPAEAGLPRPLAAVIEKASARNAEDRYQSAREFIDALDALRLAPQVGSPRPLPMPSLAGHSGTVMLPEVDRPVPSGGDFDDVTKTSMIGTDALRSASPRVDHLAATIAMPAQVEGPGATETAMVARSTTETALATAAHLAPGPPHAPRPDALWFGASPIMLVLQLLSVILIVLLLLR